MSRDGIRPEAGREPGFGSVAAPARERRRGYGDSTGHPHDGARPAAARRGVAGLLGNAW
jgi:hypothetical protein